MKAINIMRTLTTTEMNQVAGGAGSGGFNSPIGLGTVTITKAGGVTTVTATRTGTVYGPYGGGTFTQTYAGGVSTFTGTFTGSIGGFGFRGY